MEYQYQETLAMDGSINDFCVKRLPDHACIPNDPDNRDWQQYQQWLAQGNKPLPPEGAK